MRLVPAKGTLLISIIDEPMDLIRLFIMLDIRSDDITGIDNGVEPTFLQHLVQNAPAIRMMMRYGPKVGMDLSYADIQTVLVVIFCLMWNGVGEAPAIYDALGAMNCKLDRDSIDFLLHQFDGDDLRLHLWESFNGQYMPNFDLLLEDGRLAA
jgi:hypothetical protein